MAERAHAGTGRGAALAVAQPEPSAAESDEVRALYRAAGAFRPGRVQQDACAAAAAGDPQGAAAAFAQQASAHPDDACALSNLGSQLLELGPARQDEALAALRRAVDLAPRWAHPQYGLGIALQRAQDEAGAAQAYGRALALDPEHAGALASLLTMSRLLCQWDHLPALEARARCFLSGPDREPPAVLTPLASLLMPTTPHEQYEAARRWSRTVQVQAQPSMQPPAVRPRAAARCRSARGRPLRLGYLSADPFPGVHPVARQMVEMLERHARPGGRVQATVYNLSWASPADDLDVGARIRSAAHDVVEPAGVPASEAARRIADDGMDILVDLQGYTHGCRPEIVAQRPAPVQVSYLGYPGTLGGPWWDYALADRYLVPPAQARHWGERLCYLPDCYMPSDGRRTVGASPSRRDGGLPARGRGTVFCCFSHNVKINPTVWDVWMRVLRQVRGSVLWLFAGHPCVPAHLQAEAEKRGVDAGRLVFAPRLEHSAYLAAMQQADLFLDTWPYGAGATANDALWAGLPVLTLAGPTYVGRMAASQCRAAGLERDLVARSPRQYERWATVLGQCPGALRDVRRRLAAARAAGPLFDMGRYVGALEDAYGRMASRAATSG